MLGLLIVCVIFIIIYILLIGVIFSKIVLNLDNCYIYSNSGLKNIKIERACIVISFYIFKKIKIISIRLYEKYFKIFGIKLYYSKINKITNIIDNKDYYLFKGLLNFNKIKSIIKQIDFEINSFHMKLDLCTENAAITSILVSFISSMTAFLINNNIKEYKADSYYYKVNPIYLNTNAFKLFINTKISINIINLFETKISETKIYKYLVNNKYIDDTEKVYAKKV